jgi:hypothetical protein
MATTYEICKSFAELRHVAVDRVGEPNNGVCEVLMPVNATSDNAKNMFVVVCSSNFIWAF